MHTMDLEYDFPVIRHIDDVLPHIEGKKEFVVDRQKTHTIIFYRYVNELTFPPVTEPAHAILRECRGIVFDREGRILSRRMHKFFNLGEREETLPDRIDPSSPHTVLRKIDGSMVTPLHLGPAMRWATRKGLTDVADEAEQFLTTSDPSIKYKSFAWHCKKLECTPTFEFCSVDRRNVIQHIKDQMILIAVRENVTGSYLTVSEMRKLATIYNVPVVDNITILEHIRNVTKFGEEVRGSALEHIGEGVVIRFGSGHMVKIKTAEYVDFHRRRDAILNERGLVRAILKDEIDDLVPMLDRHDKKAVSKFQDEFWTTISEVTDDLDKERRLLKEMGNREYGRQRSPKLHRVARGMIFANRDRDVESRQLILDKVLESTKTPGLFANVKDGFLLGCTFTRERDFDG